MSAALENWLQQLGLMQYAAVFAENGVDLDALRLLTESDLQDLGVLLGHRRKLLRAIAELNGVDAAVPAVAAESVPQEPVRAEGERRQLTVLFCYMVGFTELANRVDPEVLQRIIRSYERSHRGQA